MPRRKKPDQPPAGTFEPASPSDPKEVLRLYAIAAKIACALPEQLEMLEDRISQLTASLVPPESAAAEDCEKLWRFFKRAVASPKITLRREAGKALFNDLDSLGQRLDLAPLTSWDALPMGVRDPKAPQFKPEVTQTHITVASIRRRARHEQSMLGDKGASLSAQFVGDLLKLLGRRDLEELFGELVGTGIMGRAEGNMLVRWLSKGGTLCKDDEALIEFLVRLGKWLVSD
ncbi:MAG: hypothetical protein A2289_10300 [Deltaproteobacteria bacterium RIFOXYA12_FULL_58_15]|nr:MAG: hypothetical protein A2289_10300 [Deltaproteobacteria bacterium RIFOXYA12_FULL_58_15]OGR13160.1 MAG: hypothetical protein A2341_08670 [Deltaproteobacteria bacterium RIFOXYB12_FULL_58_9]